MKYPYRATRKSVEMELGDVGGYSISEKGGKNGPKCMFSLGILTLLRLPAIFCQQCQLQAQDARNPDEMQQFFWKF